MSEDKMRRRERFYDSDKQIDFEFPDPEPIEVPLNTRRQPNTKDVIAEYMRQVSASADQQGFDTIEERMELSDDEPDPAWVSDYEMTEMEEEFYNDQKQDFDNEQEIKKAEEAAADDDESANKPKNGQNSKNGKKGKHSQKEGE